MRTSNRFDLDIYGGYVERKYGERNEENAKKMSVHVSNLLDKIDVCIKEYEKALKKEFKNFNPTVEVQSFSRIENSLTEEKPPTLMFIIHTKMDGIWSDFAIAADFKCILNVYMWYIRELLNQEGILFNKEYEQRGDSETDCNLCRYKEKGICNSNRKDDELIKGIGNCEVFYYDKAKSQLVSNLRTKEEIDYYDAKITNELNKLTGFNLFEKFVERVLKRERNKND